jgi:predicted component of type VI protein secretion system
MKLKTFFEEFDQFADAPDAVIFSANGAIHTSLGHRLRKGISTPIRALKGRHKPDTPNAEATTLARLPGCVMRRAWNPSGIKMAVRELFALPMPEASQLVAGG